MSMQIYKDSVDSCETFICTCSHCSKSFTMGCSDSFKMTHCPMCGIEITIQTVEDEVFSTILEESWSDRCISCRFMLSKDMCHNTDSKHYGQIIEKPKQHTCKLWRYSF